VPDASPARVSDWTMGCDNLDYQRLQSRGALEPQCFERLSLVAWVVQLWSRNNALFADPLIAVTALGCDLKLIVSPGYPMVGNLTPN